MLAGGRGRRIGGDKAIVSLAGKPLVDHVLAAVAAAGLIPLIVAKPDTDLDGITVPAGGAIHREPQEPRHPLLGLVAALERLELPLVACPCDMPLLPPPLLAHLAAREEPNVIVAPTGGWEPLLGRFSPSAAPSLRAAAERGLPAREAVATLDPLLLGDSELSRFGAPRAFLRGINDEADLRRAETALFRRES